VLTLQLKAKVPGISGAGQATQDGFKFEVDSIGNSTMGWAGNNGGKVTVNGDVITATATFTGLPTNNTDFGKKKARLLYNGSKAAENEFEVFFPKVAQNHPENGPYTGSRPPNWFFYWLQTVQLLGPNPPAVEYIENDIAHYNPGTNQIFLSFLEAGEYGAPYGLNNPLRGIDNFAWTAIHESQHYADWANLWDVDNVRRAKHQAAIGKTGPDDDRDGDRIPNYLEDVNLSHTYDSGDMYHWELYNTSTPNRPYEILNDFEDWDCQRHKDKKGDHSKDWADPGMQHKTIDRYDD
jgi:hypothetical protein